MSEPSDYTITVRRVSEDDAHIFKATVKELPYVKGVGDTYTEAYEMAIDAIGALKQMAAEDGAPFPEPAEDVFSASSGRFTLRLPKSLHKLANDLADEEGVSFNQFLVTVITDAVARRSAVALPSVKQSGNIHAALIHKAMRNYWTKSTSALGEFTIVDLSSEKIKSDEDESVPHFMPIPRSISSSRGRR